MRAYERLLNYVTYDTGSDENCPDCPSTKKQLVLAEALVKEMKEMGIADARVDAHGYVYGSIPANCEGQPAIGLIAHMDVASAVATHPVKPAIVKDYDGKNITLANGDVLDVTVFPDVAKAKGKDLIVTDGNTLLGADDKAGVSEILTACEMIMADPEKKHGKICIGFTPDEEIGHGVTNFDVANFGADFAYTLDGGDITDYEYETFNAASAKAVFHGLNIHPGSAKDKMVNSQQIAMEFHALLPAQQRPEHTQGYEGFIHLTDMAGEVEKSTLRYIIRDHSDEKFQQKKDVMTAAAAYINAKHGEGTVELTLSDSYYNMRRQIEPCMYVVDRAVNAMRALDVEPIIVPIRGGTDGARLSYMGLPCPNLGTGGENFHGLYEYACVEDMELSVKILTEILTSAQ